MTKLTEAEIAYRQELMKIQNYKCPITNYHLSYNLGEVIIVKGIEHFISNLGLIKLKNIFGDKFIEERITTYD